MRILWHARWTQAWCSRDRWMEICLAIVATISLVVLPIGRYLLFPELHTDFRLTFLGAAAIVQGLDPYQPASLRDVSTALGVPVWRGAFEPAFRRWTHPPLSGLLVLPLVPLGEVKAFLVYHMANLVCVFIAFWLAARMAVSEEGLPSSRVRHVAVACMSAWPICTSLALGQVNGFIVAALVVSAWGVTRRARWGAPLAGAPLGLAAGLTIIPGVFIVYLVMTRRWSAVGWSMAAGWATLVAPAIVSGPEVTVSAFLRSLAEIVGGSPGMDNMTLPAYIIRLYVGNEGLYSGMAYPLPGPWWQLSAALSAGLVVWGMKRAVRQTVLRAYLTLTVLTLPSAPVAWAHYTSWVMPFAVGPLIYLRTPDKSAHWHLLAVSLAVLAFLPLHELFWTQRMPDAIVALPWWQVGLIGLLIVAALDRPRDTLGPRELPIGAGSHTEAGIAA